MRGVAVRCAVWAAAVLVLAAATAGALALHARSSADRPASKQLELRKEGQRLRDIRTILSGSDLPANRGTCVWYLHVDQGRNKAHYPVAGSADWNYVISVCADGGR